VSELLGKEIQFRSGVTIAINLPSDPGAFALLPDAERILTAFGWWARLFDYPEGQDRIRYILAPAENPDDTAELLFYRLDLLQPARIKPGPRPPVEFLGGAVMTYDECANWLADLSFTHARTTGTILHRPRVLTLPSLRLAWVGPERLAGEFVPNRLQTLGKVMGAEIIHVGPKSFAHVKARLAGISGLNGVALCTGAAAYITGHVAPKTLPPEALHYCAGTTRAEIQNELITIIQTTRDQLAQTRVSDGAQEQEELLQIMLRGMMSHSKIGPFNHCSRETVLTGVRARRLNVPAADALLDHHSEAHHDTKTSEKLFLWKDHNDGRQYFLNPKRVEHAKALITTISG
jgi:hypothetical protein